MVASLDSSDRTLPTAQETKSDEPRLPREPFVGPVALLLIGVVGVFLRTYQLMTVPAGALFDEGFNAFDALRMIDGWHPIFLPANSGREALFIYLQALSIYLLGPTDWPLRVPAAIVGILTIPLSYVLIVRLFTRRVALLTSAWLAISFWHVTFSRIGLRSIILPLFGGAAFYCLWRGFEDVWSDESRASDRRVAAWPRGGLGWFGLAGIALGLSLYTYTSARFLPLVVLVFAFYLVLAHRPLFWRALPGLVLAGLLTVLIFVPEGLYFLHHPADFSFRSYAVSAFNPGLNHGDLTGTVFYSLTRTLGMFSFQGDGTWERNIPNRPIFDPISSVFLAIGLLRLLRSPRDPKIAFTLLWLAVMLVPSAISVLDAPNFLRVTGMIPALFALPAFGLDWVWMLWEKRTDASLRSIPLFVVGAGFLAGSYQTYYSYFGVWARERFVVQTFSADHWLAIGAARALAPKATKPIYVGAGDVDEPSLAYNLRGPGGTQGFRVFNDHISLILPPSGVAASYIFPERDLPPPPILNRFFPDQTGRTLAATVDGEPISLYQMPADRPDYRPEHPLVARFGDRVQVTGFDLPRDATAGQPLTVRWYWTILAPESRQLTFFNQVVGDSNDKRGSFDGRAFVPGYWPAGTSGVSTYEVPIDPATTTGAYELVVGIYYLDNLERLPIFDTLGRQAGSQLQLGPIKVRGRPAPAPLVENPHPAAWLDGIELIGDNLAPVQVSAGQKVRLTLYWRARSRPTADYTVFVHLLDPGDHVVAQADSPPQNGHDPTSLWDVGDTISDPHDLSLDPNLPPGSYSLEIGLYRPENGQRLLIRDASGYLVDDRLLLSGITVR
jgi:4-amino-4-deoxy-L-arabinose transferase-like glycosyltransferase